MTPKTPARSAPWPRVEGEVRISIRHGRVTIEQPGEQVLSTELSLPWEAVHAALCRLEDDAPSDLARCLGATLFEALLPPAARHALAARWKGAEERSARLRLCILYDDPEAAALPFEAMYSPAIEGWLARSDRVSLVRQHRTAHRQVHRTWERLRVLVVAPEPEALPKLKVDDELRAIKEGLAVPLASGRAEIRCLRGPEASRVGLQRALQSGPWQVLHVIAHGWWSDEHRQVELALQSGPSESRVGERDLEELLRDHCPRLIVLNACESGAVGPRPTDHTSAQEWRNALRGGGLPAAALRAGALSVVAMQGSVLDPHAVDFAHWFYHELAEGSPVEVAMSRARRALYAELVKEPHRFRMLLLPALYASAAEGDRFHLTPEGSAP